MKTIFLAVAARVSGNKGFSDACPHPAHTASTRQRSAISTISITEKRRRPSHPTNPTTERAGTLTAISRQNVVQVSFRMSTGM